MTVVVNTELFGACDGDGGSRNQTSREPETQRNLLHDAGTFRERVLKNKTEISNLSKNLEASVEHETILVYL